MNNKLLILALLLLTGITAAKEKESCGPDSIICRYEGMYADYSEKRATFTQEKALIRTLLAQLFTGPLLTSQINYLNSVPLASYDSVILFPAPIEEVVFSKTTYRSESEATVIRKVREVVEGLDSNGNSVSTEITYSYKLVSCLGVWKIEGVSLVTAH